MFNQKIVPKIKILTNRVSSIVFKNRENCVDLPTFQKIFNEKLDLFLDTKLENYKRYSSNLLVHDSIEYAVSLIKSGGKRIRPYLIYLSYYTEGGTNKDLIFTAGMAIELFHTFALIHDDVIDRGIERHSKETVHEYLRKKINMCPRGDKVHVSNGLAILAGDLIFSWANELIHKVNNPDVSEIYFQMIEEIVTGQILDVSFMLEYKVSAQDITRKNELKTALYSFVNPMCIGSVLAQKEYLAMYKELGMNVGQAYQIQDDLLDIIGDSNVTGKSTFVDIQDGQHTILTQYILKKAKEKDKNIFLSLFGKKIDEHGKKVLRNLYQDTGALEYAQKELNTLFNQSKTIIENSNIRPDVKDIWLDLIKIIIKRKS
jgi:geranylgeranyl diphosphate synthase type I